jgi:hypothetical protein
VGLSEEESPVEDARLGERSGRFKRAWMKPPMVNLGYISFD